MFFSLTPLNDVTLMSLDRISELADGMKMDGVTVTTVTVTTTVPCSPIPGGLYLLPMFSLMFCVLFLQIYHELTMSQESGLNNQCDVQVKLLNNTNTAFST